MKLTVLLEQWPYQMPWILVVAENLQQERDILSNATIEDSKLGKEKV